MFWTAGVTEDAGGEQATMPKLVNPPPTYAVVTVRMPHALHAGLAELAHERRHSINAVCLGLIEREIAKSEAAAKAMKDRQQAEKGKAV